MNKNFHRDFTSTSAQHFPLSHTRLSITKKWEKGTHRSERRSTTPDPTTIFTSLESPIYTIHDGVMSTSDCHSSTPSQSRCRLKVCCSEEQSGRIEHLPDYGQRENPTVRDGNAEGDQKSKFGLLTFTNGHSYYFKGDLKKGDDENYVMSNPNKNNTDHNDSIEGSTDDPVSNPYPPISFSVSHAQGVILSDSQIHNGRKVLCPWNVSLFFGILSP